MMILHTVVFSSESFLFKSESIDKATGHRFALGDLKGPLQFRFYLRRLQIQKENLSGLNTLISLKKKMSGVGNSGGEEKYWRLPGKAL